MVTKIKMKYGLVLIMSALLWMNIMPLSSRGDAKQLPLREAHWISAPSDDIFPDDACPLFKRDFFLGKKVLSAHLFITARGLYEASINGGRVGTAFFTPGWTSYGKRLQYQVYDVKDLLKKHNSLSVTLNGGWYAGVFGGDMQSSNYGKEMALLCKLDITFADGRKKSFVSDSTWRVGRSQIIASNIYDGELIDHRPVFNQWTVVKQIDTTRENLIPSIAPPVVRQEAFKAKRIFTTPKGEQVIDFGQNMAGFVRLQISGKRGDTVTLSHAEALDKDGNFFTGNLRQAKARDMYILSGKGEETFEPHFTYHGFRYAKIEVRRNGKLINPTPSNWAVTAIALYSQLRHTGTFRCSDPMINRLQNNINWSLNSNFIDIPTDCPQRSERYGWTGDAQVFVRTAAFNRNVLNFFAKWLSDLSADQGSNGAVPTIIPDFRKPGGGNPKYGVAGWGDATTIIPWTLYEIYGDADILRKQYPSMKAWVNYITGNVDTSNYIWKAKGYGDWYAQGDSTSLLYINQCFYAHSVDLLIRTAKVLRNNQDATDYAILLKKIKSSFLRNYPLGVTKATNTQTAYVLALQFDLLPEALKRKAAAGLVQKIHESNDHLATGFLGTPYLLNVLSKYGYTNLAYTLLDQQTMPSWLYPITNGATTIWEKWDAIRPDGSMDTCSLNHYAYGAVGDWLYRTIGGINVAAPGYSRIIIKPEPGGKLTWAKASYTCPFGLIRSEWHIKGKIIIYRITIPPHTTARIELPGQAVEQVGPGRYRYSLIQKSI